MDDRDTVSIRRRTRVLFGLWAAGACVAIAGGGCRAQPDTHLNSPYPAARVVAIAPFENHSGSRHVDGLVVSDLFFSELQMVRGLRALPLNRSLQQMAALNMASVAGPQDALRLAEALGADLIVVGAITSYDPYDPPEIGLAVQLYALPPGAALSGDGWPASEAEAKAAIEQARRPRSQVTEIYNAAHGIIQKKVRAFAEIRGAEDSAFGWRLYLKSIPHYARFCCHQAIVELLRQEDDRVRGPPSDPPAEQRANRPDASFVRSPGSRP